MSGMPTSVTPKGVRETQRWMRGSSVRPLPPSESAGWRGPPSTRARRAGVARATIYLRYPSRDLLITAAIRAAIGASRSTPPATSSATCADRRAGSRHLRVAALPADAAPADRGSPPAEELPDGHHLRRARPESQVAGRRISRAGIVSRIPDRCRSGLRVRSGRRTDLEPPPGPRAVPHRPTRSMRWSTCSSPGLRTRS